jgi:hypothetical protein
MATLLTKPVCRLTLETRFEAGSMRSIIVTLEPAGHDSARVGIRLKGTRQTFRIGVNSIYNLAVAHHNEQIEKRARQLKKEGVPARSAKAQARKELAKDLK